MNVGPTQGVQGITENDIAEYLANTPGFFERQAELLSSVQLSSPHGQRAVSLQERQMEMLRDEMRVATHWHVVDSIYGHDAFLKEVAAMSRIVAEALGS